jgi:pimeloyl-ACP methyl ester carboxylesterase
MSRTTLSLNADGLRIAGITPELDLSDGPLIVALHGGSYTSTYFDVPRHSLLTRAANNRLRVIALDRPCYGRSDALPADNITFGAGAKALDTAIARLWDDYGTHHTGVVLVGHSIGGAICIHIASQAPDWPLLGITISGIHDVTPEQVRNAWDAMPAGQPVEFTPEQRRMFFYGPEWTIEPDIISRADASTAPIPLAELLEVVTRWPDQAAKLAANITVPVQYLAFEFERLWCIDADSVRSFADYFTGAPLVLSELMAGIGHNADHHRNSQAFHLRQLAFALDCAQRTARPASTATASAK